MPPVLGSTIAPHMPNAFDFDWMFDCLSLGTTYLYRKYLEGAMLAAEEGVWRRSVDGTCSGALLAFNFDKFDEAYPDLIPSERLRLRGHWPDIIEGEVVAGEDRGLRTQVRAGLYNEA